MAGLLCIAGLGGAVYFVASSSSANMDVAAEAEATAIPLASPPPIVMEPAVAVPASPPDPTAGGGAPGPAVPGPSARPAAPASRPPATGLLEFQVVDARTRGPLLDGRVAVALASEAAVADPRSWRSLPSFKTGSIQGGKVEVDGLPAGEYFYAVTAAGGRPASGRVWVGTGKVIQLVAVERRSAEAQGDPRRLPRGNAPWPRNPRGGREGRNGAIPPDGSRMRGRNPGGERGSDGTRRSLLDSRQNGPP